MLLRRMGNLRHGADDGKVTQVIKGIIMNLINKNINRHPSLLLRSSNSTNNGNRSQCTTHPQQQPPPVIVMDTNGFWINGWLVGLLAGWLDDGMIFRQNDFLMLTLPNPWLKSIQESFSNSHFSAHFFSIPYSSFTQHILFLRLIQLYRRVVLWWNDVCVCVHYPVHLHITVCVYCLMQLFSSITQQQRPTWQAEKNRLKFDFISPALLWRTLLRFDRRRRRRLHHPSPIHVMSICFVGVVADYPRS